MLFKFQCKMLEEIKSIFSEFGRYWAPAKGEINFHNQCSKRIGNSKLEVIAMDVAFATFKYLAYFGIARGLYYIINDLYSWKHASGILKGI